MQVQLSVPPDPSHRADTHTSLCLTKSTVKGWWHCSLKLSSTRGCRFPTIYPFHILPWYADRNKMPHTQFENCTSVYGTTYIVPVVGDTAEFLAITERSYTYRLRSANPRLCPSQFSRHTVDKVFQFMIERLRHIRDTKYGVENFLALLTDTEKRVSSLLPIGPLVPVPSQS